MASFRFCVTILGLATTLARPFSICAVSALRIWLDRDRLTWKSLVLTVPPVMALSGIVPVIPAAPVGEADIEEPQARAGGDIHLDEGDGDVNQGFLGGYRRPC